MSLDMKNEAEMLQKLYQEDVRNQAFNAIIYGDIGTGKTHLLRTCRRPILIHSFDPGGLKTLRNDPGFMKDILPDSRYEKEDAKKPSCYVAWEKEFDRLRKEDFFTQVGTYVIDSATTWADALMNEVLKRAGRTAGTPQQMDWMVQMNTIRDAMKIFTSLPCDCILTAHVDYQKDEATGRMLGAPLLTGKLKQKIPLLFDEIYVTVAKETSTGTQYSLLTKATGLLQARTRLGTGGLFDTYEKPDIKYLLAKAGLDASDKA